MTSYLPLLGRSLVWHSPSPTEIAVLDLNQGRQIDFSKLGNL
jgi:hypothetical protein